MEGRALKDATLSLNEKVDGGYDSHLLINQTNPGMNPEENNQMDGVEPQIDAGDDGEGQDEVITLKKSDYDKLNQTLGSLKRENKDLKKPKESALETPKKTDDDGKILERVERMALRTAGITHQDDIELAQKTSKKWGVDIDQLLDDPDFKVKLERQQADRANVEATSDLKGSGNAPSNAKNSSEYWLSKGVPPTPTDVPDSTIRRKIISDMRKSADDGSALQFYNS